jgi:hypothetical protein
MATDETSLSHASSREPEQKTPSARPWQKTSSWKLLNEAVAALGADRLADALDITTGDVLRLLSAERPMTHAQQRVLAIAVFILSDNHRALHRRAASLLAQVHAAEDFASGITERHMHPPELNRWLGF